MRGSSCKPTAPIQSLDRGLFLLEKVAEAQRPVSLAELTALLRLDRSSVFRLANTLRRRGFLAQVPGSKDYVLGSAVWRLAHLFAWYEVLRQLAREQVVTLAAATGETTHLAVREGQQAILVDHQLTQQALGVSTCCGRSAPLHCTSVGKALLVDFDYLQLAKLLGPAELPGFTERTIQWMSELAEQCRRARRAGFAVDDEEYSEGVRCVAAPIRDSSGAVVASIGVSAPVERIPLRRIQEIGRRVKAAADGISARLGHVPTGASGPAAGESSQPRVPRLFNQRGKRRTER